MSQFVSSQSARHNLSENNEFSDSENIEAFQSENNRLSELNLTQNTESHQSEKNSEGINIEGVK